jgi:PST family polysaccharide transporter
MSPSILLVAAGAVPVAVLRRELRYRTVALRMVSGRLVGGVGGIACAFLGFGVWSLVVQQVATVFVALLTILALDWSSVPAVANPRHALPMLRFGLVTLVVNLMAGGNVKLFLLACGLLLSTRELGLLSLALRIVDTLAAIILGAQARVALSLFSRAYHSSGSLASPYMTGARLSACVIIPVFALLAVDARDAVLLIAGPKWADITVLVQMMAVTQIASSLMFLRGAALTAVGRPAVNMVTAAVDLSAAILLLLLLAPWGAVGAGAAWSLRILATIPVGAILLRRHTGLGFLPILTASRQALYAAGGLMLGALLAAYALPDASPWLRLPVCVCAGLSVYGLVLWLLDPDLLRQVRSLARSVLMPAGEEQLAGPVS